MDKGMFWTNDASVYSEEVSVNILALTGYVLVYSNTDTDTEAFESGLAAELE
ncbi:hypothetical protein [Deinococcus roseus]|uniref:Uncharacterized protein n=1 Tax=Deinococcus roseus TaxID=392414 RepID=A0ABQ2DFD3_9DEIO|nr:hypothetical protein [Deinococcus roseus]GGJ54862.1 hypothetical protein GCM10008938_46160 [Deinococcus roseus]